MLQTRIKSRRGVSSTGVVVAGGALVVLVAMALLASGGGDQEQIQSDTDHHVVKRGDFEVTVPANGELIAGDQVELKSELDGRATITEIIDEGESVEIGDVLVQFDDKEARERIERCEDEVVAATNRVETRTGDLAIAQKSRESSVAKANVAVDQAQLALLSWSEGDVVSKRNQLSLDLRTAEKNWKRLEEKYQKSLELRSRDFISQNDLERDEIEMIRAEAAFSQAKLSQEVYEKYTYPRDKQRMESDLKQTQDELERVITRTDASVRSAESNLEAAHKNLESKVERLEKYREQLQHCTITAPAPGMVVYGTTINRERWGDDKGLRVGSQVSRNQLLIVLPDSERMLANVKVNEALSGQIQQDQQALISIDAFPDVKIDGAVISVGVLAESGGWRDPNNRKYAVIISVEEHGQLGLKPSMRCKARIRVDTVVDALSVPVQAVHRVGRSTIVYVADGGTYRPVDVELGRSSELFVEVLGGLSEGDEVLLRDPPPGMIIAQAEDDTE